MKLIIVRCKCRSCGFVVEMENRQLLKEGFRCPKCVYPEYDILL